MTLVGWMLYAVAESALVAPAAWLLERGIGRFGAPTRWIWTGSLALCVALPGVAALGTASTLATPAAVDVSAQPVIAVPFVDRPAHDVDGWAALRVRLERWSATVDWTLASVATPLARTATDFAALILALWTAASLLMALAIVVGAFRLTRTLRSWPLEAHRGREVRIAPELGPATVGLLRPRIVIPRWAAALPPDELELILAHEEEHVRRKDPLLLGWGLAAVVAFPWNPLVWWQHRRMRDAVEVDCDRRVLRRGTTVAGYGDLLVRIGSGRARRFMLAPTINGSKSLLERRLAAMKKTNLRAMLPRSLATTALSVGLLVVACTTEMPITDDGAVGVDPAASVQERNQRVADVWVEPDGRVSINDVIYPMEEVSGAIRWLDATTAGGIYVSITAHPGAPYRVVEDLQREIQQSVARVAFGIGTARPAPTPPGDPTEVMDGLRLVLPQLGEAVQVSARNLLHLIVQPSGVVEVRRGTSDAAQPIRPVELTALWRREVLANPNLIAAVKVHPDANYANMVEVLDALHAADAERISIQELEVPS